MTKKRNEREEDLFFKVSIANIHNGIIGEVGLREFAVLAAITSFANDKGECFPSQETLAEICGVTRRTIIRLIDNLCEYRTADGQAILVRRTERKGLSKSMNHYSILPSAGMTFGANKVVTNLSPRNSGGNVVTNSNEVVTKQVKRLCQNGSIGSDKSVTLTKAIELNPLEQEPIEQEREKTASFVEVNKDCSKTNKDSSSIVETKEPIFPKVNQSEIVEGLSRKEITSSIVAYGRSKAKEKDEGGTASMTTIENESPSDVPNVKKATSLPSHTAALSEREILVFMAERNRRAAEEHRKAEREERRKKAREEAAAIAHMTAHKGDRRLASDSEGISSDEKAKTHTGRSDRFVGIPFEQLLVMSEEEIRQSGV